MDKVTLANFRCFRERQTARLAPLTFLVGENSTGKTSFMAMVRILWRVIMESQVKPDFKEAPYDLGSFREIVHRGSDGNGSSEMFSAGLAGEGWECHAKFAQGRASTEVMELHLTDNEDIGITWIRTSEDDICVRASIGDKKFNGKVRSSRTRNGDHDLLSRSSRGMWGLDSIYYHSWHEKLSSNEKAQLEELAYRPYIGHLGKSQVPAFSDAPEAIAPVRSTPQRSYDPGVPSIGPDGSGIPSYLNALAGSEPESWRALKRAIEGYGRKANVFDEIRVRNPGPERSSDPFQIQVRTAGDHEWRNLVDVGYGVSQVLPLLYQFALQDGGEPVVPPFMLQMQQPEVHLHPRAQAGLGSILCDVAANGQQLLVETHSDYLIDRVRMNVRDKTVGLKPEDVSILYFEREAGVAWIHSIGVDENGNVTNTPEGYRQFFMDETRSFLGL